MVHVFFHFEPIFPVAVLQHGQRRVQPKGSVRPGTVPATAVLGPSPEQLEVGPELAQKGERELVPTRWGLKYNFAMFSQAIGIIGTFPSVVA
jgi:hypothetical protein